MYFSCGFNPIYRLSCGVELDLGTWRIIYTVHSISSFTHDWPKKRCSLSTAFPAFVYRMSHNRPFYRCAVPIMALVSLVKIKPLACCLSHWLGRSSWLSAKRMQDTHDLHATAQQDMDGEWALIISLSIYIMQITCILYNTSPVSRCSSLYTRPTADRFWQPLLSSTALLPTCHFTFCQFLTRFESFFKNLKLIES